MNFLCLFLYFSQFIFSRHAGMMTQLSEPASGIASVTFILKYNNILEVFQSFDVFGTIVACLVHFVLVSCILLYSCPWISIILNSIFNLNILQKQIPF